MVCVIYALRAGRLAGERNDDRNQNDPHIKAKDERRNCGKKQKGPQSAIVLQRDLRINLYFKSDEMFDWDGVLIVIADRKTV